MIPPKRARRSKKQLVKQNYYIDGPEFTRVMNIGYDNMTKAQQEWVGECIVKIIKRLISSAKFSGYSWKDLFFSEALGACVRGLQQFDGKRLGRNQQPVTAFNYFTTCALRAFYAVIAKQERQLGIKHALMEAGEGFNMEDSEDSTVLAEDMGEKILADHKESFSKYEIKLGKPGAKKKVKVDNSLTLF